MSKQDEEQLEKLIKEVFFKAKRKSITPKNERLKAIIKRGLYETAFKDLIIFSSHMLTAMLMMFSLLLKTFSINTK